MSADGSSSADVFELDPADAGPAPRIVATRPAHGTINVYPAALGPSGGVRVRIEVDFDQPMDPSSTTVLFGAVESTPFAISGEYSGAQSFALELLPPFGSTAALSDETRYRLDVSSLMNHAGTKTSTAMNAIEFTTGRYDALLNHSCGHVLFGPFAAVDAAPSPIDAPRTDSGHTHYTVRLDQAPFHYTALQFTARTRLTLFLEEAIPLALRDPTGFEAQLAVEETPRACEGIAARTSTVIEADVAAWLRFGPTDHTVVKMIVELSAVE